VVCRESRGTVVIDRQKGKMIDKIEMGYGPVRVVITPDGKRLVVPLFHSDAIQIVDTKKRKVTYTINIGKQPAGIAISRDGTLVFMSCEEENAVYVFSMETIEVINIIKIGPGCDEMVCLDGNEI
jgi:YVTN family beta-propeller protein